MSTRALYFFKDQGVSEDYLVVYKHHDGYPSGAVEHINAARDSGLTWSLPRWEADEFGAAFVAANKPGAGGVRLCPSAKSVADYPECGDEFRYVIEADGDGRVWVTGFTTPWAERGNDVTHPAVPVLKRTLLSALSADAIIEEDN